MVREVIKHLDDSLTSKMSSKCVVLLSSKICLLKIKFCKKSHLKFSLTNILVWGFWEQKTTDCGGSILLRAVARGVIHPRGETLALVPGTPVLRSTDKAALLFAESKVSMLCYRYRLLQTCLVMNSECNRLQLTFPFEQILVVYLLCSMWFIKMLS